MKKHVICILGGGALWGLMGLFTRNLAARGFDSPGTLIVRFAIASLLFGVTLLLVDPKLFRVRLRDAWCFLGAGIYSLLFFTYFYFQAIATMSLSVAAILLYTAPSMVMVMSLLIFKERLTPAKLVALLLAFAGCCLVSGLGGADAVSALGVVYGLCSGLGYALYSIFARLALDRGYDSRTINFYSCLLATVGACVIWGGVEPARLMFASGGNALWCIATGVVSCYLPYLLYTYGLSGVEAGKASVMASVEPVVATLVGILVFREKMTWMSAAGVLLVLGAVVILNLRFQRREAGVKN